MAFDSGFASYFSNGLPVTYLSVVPTTIFLL